MSCTQTRLSSEPLLVSLDSNAAVLVRLLLL